MADKKPKPVVWTGRTMDPARGGVDYTPPVFLRNIYHTRVVVTEAQTPSGTRYDFQPGEVKAVSHKDAPSFLAMQKEQTSCCGGVANLPPIKYFTVA